MRFWWVTVEKYLWNLADCIATGTESPAMRDRLCFLFKARSALQNTANKLDSWAKEWEKPTSGHKINPVYPTRFLAIIQKFL
jgi:hypothetical protein